MPRHTKNQPKLSKERFIAVGSIKCKSSNTFNVKPSLYPLVEGWYLRINKCNQITIDLTIALDKPCNRPAGVKRFSIFIGYYLNH